MPRTNQIRNQNKHEHNRNFQPIKKAATTLYKVLCRSPDQSDEAKGGLKERTKRKLPSPMGLAPYLPECQA